MLYRRDDCPEADTYNDKMRQIVREINEIVLREKLSVREICELFLVVEMDCKNMPLIKQD